MFKKIVLGIVGLVIVLALIGGNDDDSSPSTTRDSGSNRADAIDLPSNMEGVIASSNDCDELHTMIVEWIPAWNTDAETKLAGQRAVEARAEEINCGW